jgi:hypothetical protein
MKKCPSGPLNETPTAIRVILSKFLAMKADQSADCAAFSLPGNAPDCTIGFFIGLHDQKSI